MQVREAGRALGRYAGNLRRHRRYLGESRPLREVNLIAKVRFASARCAWWGDGYPTLGGESQENTVLSGDASIDGSSAYLQLIAQTSCPAAVQSRGHFYFEQNSQSFVSLVAESVNQFPGRAIWLPLARTSAKLVRTSRHARPEVVP